MAKKQIDTFNQKEVATAINNALTFSLRPSKLEGQLPEKRLTKLRSYALPVFAPLIDMIEEEVLRPEEVVIIALAGAMLVQALHVMKTTHLPAVAVVEDLFTEELVADARNHSHTR